MGFVYFYDDTTMGTLLCHSYQLSREIKKEREKKPEVDILMDRCKDLSREEASLIIRGLADGIDAYKQLAADRENREFKMEWYFMLKDLNDNQKEACLRNLAQLSRSFIRKELKDVRNKAVKRQLKAEDAQLDKLLKEGNAFREEEQQKQVCDLFFERYAYEMAQQSVKAVMQSTNKLSEAAIEELSDASDEKAMTRALATYITYREYARFDSSAREMDPVEIGAAAATGANIGAFAFMYYKGQVTLDGWITKVKEAFQKLLYLLLEDQTRLLAKVIHVVLTGVLGEKAFQFVIIALVCGLTLSPVFSVLAATIAAVVVMSEFYDSSTEDKIYELLQLAFKNIREFFASARAKLYELVCLSPEQAAEAEAQVNKLQDMLAKEGVTEEEAIEAVRRMQRERAEAAAETGQAQDNVQNVGHTETVEREKVEEEPSQTTVQSTPILA